MNKLKNKIVSNNLTAVLKAKKVTSTALLSKLSAIGYPMQKQRYFDVKKNRREMYFQEAIIMAEILGVKYTELVNGNINKLINKPIN